MKAEVYWVTEAPDRLAVLPRPRGGDYLVDEIASLHDQGLDVLVSLLTGVGLLLSELMFFPSSGVLPTGGAILLCSMAGLVWSRVSGRPGRQLIALGLGIASGALFTGWSPATNAVFVFGGLATIAIGVSRSFAPAPAPEPPARGRKRRRSRGRRRSSGRPRSRG